MLWASDSSLFCHILCINVFHIFPDSNRIQLPSLLYGHLNLRKYWAR